MGVTESDTIEWLSLSFFFFFDWRIIALQCGVGFCHTTIGHTFPPSWASLHPHPTPLGHHRVLARPPVLDSSSPLTAYFTHVVYICQCYFLTLSQLLPLLWPQVCSLYLRLYSCPANRFISTIFSRFHIYALIYDTCFSLTYPFCIAGSRFIHLSSTDSHSFPFMTE